ncbi:hypothetical protein HJG60_010535 [Phyllostomus discolor]|uniref:KH-like RNA-binding domain-containing protein n=1 Tax=Phyllostomus discolor TaxID=89673 RepID=A0A834EF48_9CHIR|nr:hypothetical protein HJG60_010535 [Phyllostomus discolor]
MGLSVPSDLNSGPGNGVRPNDDPEQIAQPRDQQEEFPLQKVAVSLQMPPRSHFKYFPKPSVLQVEACMLEKIFGPSRALLPTFQREFEVLIQMGEPDPEGKVEVRITGSPWYRRRAKKMLYVLNEKSRKKNNEGKEFHEPRLWMLQT